ncbi:hypothetical protein PMI14_02076 [Acidovorax sp. CF316]|uniref:hypothetical protein n=1 Tax=Acidovorax sp. CF316 TaxID=1144317 RepID=UPI00026BDE89|nr:hypothetical protein [Acidovorax sp. CF316]EJE53177.1 hypothetical protein PMI14_02076 [Acidovorax sp. CF316]
MRRFAFGYLFLAIVALCLSAYCFVQVPLYKSSTEVTLEAIEHHYIDRGRFTAQELADLDWFLHKIKSNSRADKLVRERVRQAGMNGFWAFTLFCGLMGFSMLDTLRKQAEEIAAADGGTPP